MTLVQKSKTLFAKFIADDKGLAAIEYGLLAAGIAIGLWAVIGDVGTSLSAIFTTVQGDLAAPPQ